MGWLYDEDISRPTVAQFNESGFRGVHIEYDLGKGGTLDPGVVEIARKENRTIITADPTEFLGMNNATLTSVMILNSGNIVICA